MKPIGTQPQCVRSPWRRLLQLPVSLLRTSARPQTTPTSATRTAPSASWDQRPSYIRAGASVARSGLVPRAPLAWRPSVLNPTHRATVVEALALSLRCSLSCHAERRLMFRSSSQSSSASPARINAWIVASQANAPELSRGARNKMRPASAASQPLSTKAPSASTPR